MCQRPRAWHPVPYGHWPQADSSQASLRHSMWTLKRIRTRKEGLAFPRTIALIWSLCYTWHLTEPSYPEELLETGLPRLRKQPRLPSRMCVLSLEHRFPWTCADETKGSVDTRKLLPGKAKDLEGAEGSRCSCVCEGSATWSTPLGQDGMAEGNCLGGAE